MGVIRFTTTLVPRGPAAAVILDEEQAQTVGEGAKRFPVIARLADRELRLSVARMGGEYLLGFSRASREQAGVQAGDTFELELELDAAPREVAVPEALAAALAEDAAAQAAFEGLAYSHRKEFVRWIEESKREETRSRRIAQTLERLREGRTRR